MGPRAWPFVALGGLIVLAGIWLGRNAPPPPAADIPLSRPLITGPLRVVTLGTSLTARPQIWPDALARALGACRSTAVEVIRLAGPGQNVSWGLGQLPQVIAARPDLVLVEFAINDASLQRGMRLSRATGLHRDLITGLQQGLPDAQIVLMTMSPAYGPRGLIRPWLAQHYAAYAPLAQSMGTGFVDLHAHWQDRPRAAQGLQEDGLHPAPEVAAEVIVPALMAYLDLDQICP